MQACYFNFFCINFSLAIFQAPSAHTTLTSFIPWLFKESKKKCCPKTTQGIARFNIKLFEDKLRRGFENLKNKALF
jgi:hypothetical protein